VGRTSAINGAFRLSGDKNGMRVERGMRLDVDVSTLKSDDERRDNSMRTVGIETDLYPTATFVTTADIVIPAELASAAQATVNVVGDLTLHGVTRSVTIPMRTQYTGGRVEVVGSLSFPWAFFGMTQPNKSYVTVEADPTLEFQVFFDHGLAQPAS
jgi:polyisoprenoid-binding protein YceI